MRVGADLSDLEKATDKVKGHFAKLEQVRRSEAANRQDSLTQELDEANQKVQELKKQYRELVGGMGQADTEKGLLKQLREVEKARAELDKEYANKDGTLKNNIPEDVMLQYDALARRSDELYAKVKQIRLNPAATPEAQALGQKLREAYKNAADLQKELNSANGDAAAAGVGKGTSLKAKVLDGLAAAGNGVKTVMGGIGGAAAKGLGLLTQGVKTGASALGKFLGKQANKTLDSVKNLGSGIGRLAKRITSLAASALVFNVLSQGFRSVQQGITGMAESDSQLKASLAGIQGNLLTAFAPLWQTVLPMVRAVTAALASLAGMIAQVMAALFGTTTSAAQKSAAAYSKQASAATGSAGATKKAAEEAKKAQREAMDFDILHKVSDNSSEDSSSGGGGGAGVGSDFGAAIKSTPLADQLVQAIKDDDWYKVGSIFAEKLNDAMDMRYKSKYSTNTGDYPVKDQSL